MPDPEQQRRSAVRIVSRLRDAGHEAVFAGGCVRDALLGKTPKDYDVATSAAPKTVQSLFGRRKTVAVGAAFGVIVVLDPPAEPTEVATFRNDGQYVDGRRPEGVVFSTAEEDAQRRDFTINGMFFDPLEERLIDYVGGRDDLAAARLRAIGDPRRRFDEDKLRLLRAIRFATRLGFEIEPETATAIEEFADQLPVVSAERIAAELRRMLTHETAAESLRRLADFGLLPYTIPEAADPLLGFEQRPAVLLATSPLGFPPALAVAAGLPKEGSSKLGRLLKLSNEERTSVESVCAAIQRAPGFADRSLAERKRYFHHGERAAVLEILAALPSDAVPETDRAAIVDFAAEMPAERIDPPPLLQGRDLVAAGFSPGPQFGDWLAEVRTAQLNEQIATTDEALAIVRRLEREGEAE